MKRNGFFLRNFMRMILFLIVSILFTKSVKAQDFELVKNTEGIQIYNRYVDGLELKEFRAVTVMKTSLSALVAVLKDTPSFQKWMHRCTHSELARETDFYHRYSYVINSAPWPVNNRDLVVYSSLSQDASTGIIKIKLESKPNFLPLKKGLVRIPVLNGYWIFKPLGNGEVEVIYQLYSDPGGDLPALLANSTTVDVPFQTLRNMKKIVSEEKYQKSNYNEIIEK